MPTPVTPENVASYAALPASASVDGQSATAHSLRDVIELLKFQAAAGGATPGAPVSPWRGAARAVGIPQNSRGY